MTTRSPPARIPRPRCPCARRRPAEHTQTRRSTQTHKHANTPNTSITQKRKKNHNRLHCFFTPASRCLLSSTVAYDHLTSHTVVYCCPLLSIVARVYCRPTVVVYFRLQWYTAVYCCLLQPSMAYCCCLLLLTAVCYCHLALPTAVYLQGFVERSGEDVARASRI